MSGTMLLVIALVLVCGVAASLRVRRLTTRMRALARPTHEVRGALTALDLGLSLVERSPLSGLELAARADGLRLQLERAREGLVEIDALRGGDGEVADGGGRVLVDLEAAVAMRARAWAQLAPGYGSALRYAWHAGPVFVRGDRSLLVRALDNLIANALEHGGGRVVVVGEREGARVRVSISDNGAGLRGTPDAVRPATASSARGHGLGIARDAVERHGGSIFSALRRGRAAVVIELPVASPAPEPPRAGSARPAGRHAGEATRVA